MILFAAAPLLEANKVLVSAAVTAGIGFCEGAEDSGMKIGFVHIGRASFQGDAMRTTYVEVPHQESGPGMCAKRKRSMYGTDDRCPELGPHLYPVHAERWVQERAIVPMCVQQ